MNTMNRTGSNASPSRRGLMRVVALASALVAAGSLTGCNNAIEGGATGAALGALVGMGLGSLTGDMGKGAAAGALGGAALGGILGDQNYRR